MSIQQSIKVLRMYSHLWFIPAIVIIGVIGVMVGLDVMQAEEPEVVGFYQSADTGKIQTLTFPATDEWRTWELVKYYAVLTVGNGDYVTQFGPSSVLCLPHGKLDNTKAANVKPVQPTPAILFYGGYQIAVGNYNCFTVKVPTS